MKVAAMQHESELWLDAASGLSTGRRQSQQDALVSDFPLGTGFGLAVLADGMGGHAAGDVAAKIAITEVYSDLKLRGPGLDGDILGSMRRAALAANRCISAHCSNYAETSGMGTTLLVLVVDQLRLHWLSVGDSLLYLWRDGKLRHLNRRHSMADRIDWLISTGQLDPELGRSHPDRHLLTSCLNGDRIEQIDTPERPMLLQPGDIIVMASDGIETLSELELTQLIRDNASAPAATIIAALLEAVAAHDEPEQDNLSLTVVRPCQSALPSRAVNSAHSSPLVPSDQETWA